MAKTTEEKEAINKKTKNTKNNKDWTKLPILTKILVIFAGIAVSIFIFLPGLLIMLSAVIPGIITNTDLLNKLENGLQIIVGIISLLLAIISMLFAKAQDQKITASLNKITEIERKIDMSKMRKSYESSSILKSDPKEK